MNADNKFMQKRTYYSFQRKFLLFTFLILMHSISYALPFNIFPKAGTQLPSLFRGFPLTAYYTIANNTISQRNNNFIKYLPPNVTQVTNGGTFSDTCGSTFNLAASGQAGDSCTLQLSITGAVNATDPNPHNHLFACFPGGITCAGTANSLNLLNLIPIIFVAPTNASINALGQQQFTATAAYPDGAVLDVTSLVTWSVGNPQIASITSSGLATGLSSGSTPITATLNSATGSATLNVTAFAYVVNAQAGHLGIVFSSVSPNGSLGTFHSTGSGAAFIFGMNEITINPSGSFIYVTNVSNIISCPLQSDGSAGVCSPSGVFTFAVAIAVNPSGTFIYIYDANTQNITICGLNPNGTISGSCNTSPFAANINGMAINPAGNFLFAAESTNVICVSAIDPNNGSLGPCRDTLATHLNQPTDITINPAGTIAYIANGTGGLVTFCSILANGSLTNCQTTGGGFSPGSISLNGAGTIAYITNSINSPNGSVSACPINSDGTFGMCSTTNGLAGPAGIVIS